MLVNFFFFIFFYFLIFYSIIGFGHLLCRITKLDTSKISNGIIGILGIFFLTFLSYFTNLFLSHNKTHNFIVLILGFLFFIKFFFLNKNFNKKYILRSTTIVLLTLSAIFLSKNNEDFPYYHFSYIINLTENKLEFGLSLFNQGFGTSSSVFYLASLFYLPFVDHYLFHITGLIVLSLANIFFLDKFFFCKNINNKFTFFLSIFGFLFYNIVFWRLAEYGTDRAGQILVYIIIIKIFDLYYKWTKQSITVILILIIYLLSFKSYFIFYSLLVLFLVERFLINVKKNYIFELTFFLPAIIISFFYLGLYFFKNFANTGCVVYPLPISCFPNFIWSRDLLTVSNLSTWFELWSKSGATPNYIVSDVNNYLENLNWVKNWFKNYFFYKFTDTFFGILAIAIIILICFRKNKKKHYTSVYPHQLFIYFYLLVLSSIWFLKHPDLRYGGYVILALLIFIPLSIFLSFYSSNLIEKKKIIILTAIVFIFFNIKNFNRIYQEFNRSDQYKYTNFPFYADKHLSKLDKKNSNQIENFSYKFYLNKKIDNK